MSGMRGTCLAICLLASVSVSGEVTAVSADHVMVYFEPGRFGGWPANHGIWIWGEEILVGFSRGFYKDLGPTRHHIDREKPEEHLLARSLDGGQTWAIEDPAAKGQLLPQGEALHGTELPGVATPEAAACPGDIDFTHPDFAFTARMSSVGAGSARFYYSDDRGHDWKGPFALPSFGAPGIAARTDYIVNGPEDCMLFLTAAKRNAEEGRPLCVRTTDGGAHWDLVSWIGPEPEGFAIMPASVRISDTEILVLLRCREGPRRWIAAYLSLDNGQTWRHLDDPVDDLGEGNPPALIRLADDRLCLTYAYRAKPFKIAAKLSRDGGLHWNEEIVLRDDGADRDVGYTRSVQRPDGKVVTLYYFNDKETGPERYIAATIWDPPAME